MSNPWDTSAGPPPSLLQALGMGHLGEVLAQGPRFEAVLAQSPGAEPRLSPTSAALRRSSPPRGSAAPWLSSSALRSAAPCRAAGGCGPGAPRSPWGAGWKGGRGGSARGAAAGMDAGRMPGPAPRPSEAGGGALPQSAAGLLLPRGAAGMELCRRRGCAARFGLRQDGRSRAAAAALSLRCTFPLFGSRCGIPQHNLHHAPGPGSQPLPSQGFSSHLLENGLRAAWLLLLCSDHHRGLVEELNPGLGP